MEVGIDENIKNNDFKLFSFQKKKLYALEKIS